MNTKKLQKAFVLLIFLLVGSLTTQAQVFTNEIHYDNSGTDLNEKIEIVGLAGTNLSGYSIVLYDGSTGQTYASAINLSGIIPNQCSIGGKNLGTVVIDVLVTTGFSFQNGGSFPDGWALMNGATVVELLSYEGTFTATNGPAIGVTSSNIAALEDGTGTANGSIQRTGANTWVTDPNTNTFAGCNSTQYFPGTNNLVNLSISATQGTEASLTAITLTATTSSNVSGNQSVSVAVSGGFITAGDYTLSNSIIIIPTGSNTGSVTFTVANDAIYEGREVATVVINNPTSGITLGPNISRDITIFDNDAKPAADIFSNEIHYDNIGVDANERIEIAGLAVTNLNGWAIILYDGSTGLKYGNQINLAGTLPNNCIAGGQNIGAVVVDVVSASGGFSFQNEVDGWALINSNGGVFDFFSYGGTFIANNGPALGLNSVNIGALENNTTATTNGSIQRTGAASWVQNDNVNTFGACNSTQYFPASSNFVNLSVSTNTATEAAATIVTVTATATTNVPSNQTLQLEVSGAFITAADYSLSNATITIPAGSNTGAVTFTIINDAIYESREVATLTISNPSNGISLGNTIAQAITIIDNETKPVADIFSNEIHYDNINADVNEKIEIAGFSGTNLSGWSVVLYDGSNGQTYGNPISLSGILPQQCTIGGQNIGTVVLDVLATAGVSLQNAVGGGDGWALINSNGGVFEFYSYGGAFTANNGPALGMLSTDIGVVENNISTTTLGSIQRIGNTSWQGNDLSNTFGACNSTQYSPVRITQQPANSFTCNNQTATFSIIATGGISYQWQQNAGSGFANISNAGVYSGANTNTLTISAVTISFSGSLFRCIVNNEVTSNSASLTVNVITGNPAVFGANTWNIYAFNSGNGTLPGSNWLTNYSGFYTNDNLDIQTQLDWNNLLSPSASINYQGCSVAPDNHSYSAKRKGFPCELYQINIAEHNDAAQLFINGQLIWEHNGCCDSHTNVWTGFLGPSDSAEFRVTEGTGPSSATLNFISLPQGPLVTTTNNGLHFDGIDDHVQVSNCTPNPFLNGGNAVTVEYWFKGTNTQSAVRIQDVQNNYLVAGWNGLHILSNDGGTANGLSVGSAATDGNWHHVAFSWQQGAANGFKTFLDGQLVAQRDAANIPLPVINYPLVLGSFMGASEFMNGTLDEVRIWNVARTQTQIQAGMVDFCKQFPLPQAGLVLYYKFDVGQPGQPNAANILQNYANPSNHLGVLKNFALTGNASNYIDGTFQNVEWTGAANTDWNNKDNWACEQRPNFNSTVIIPGGKSNYPAQNISGTIKKLSVLSGGTITMPTANSLTILQSN